MRIKSFIKRTSTVLFLTTVITNLAFSQNTPVFEIKNIEAQKALIIKGEVLSSEIGPKMGEMYGQLFAYTAKNDIQPAGAPFAVYYSFDPAGKTSFEVGCPITANAVSGEEIMVKEYPAMKVVSTLYTGAYENMMPIYEKMDAYIKSNNLKINGPSWEVYLTDPKEVKDQNENKTIIYFPID